MLTRTVGLYVVYMNLRGPHMLKICGVQTWDLSIQEAIIKLVNFTNKNISQSSPTRRKFMTGMDSNR